MSDYKDKYTTGKKLGEGSFGTVWAAEHKQAKTPVAIKTVRKSKLTDATLVKLM